MTLFLQYTTSGIVVGSFISLVALGFTIVYGIIRLINFAHGDHVMCGCFFGWTMLVPVGLAGSVPAALAIILACVVAAVGSAALNVGIFHLAVRPLLKRSLIAIFITSLGMSQVLQNGAQLIFGSKLHEYPTLIGYGGFDVLGARIQYVQVMVLVISLALMAVLSWFAQKTMLGTAMRALAVDHEAAHLMGIDVTRVITIAFAVAGALAGVGGVLIGVYYNQFDFFSGFLIGLRAFTAAVIGGIGNIPGAMVGGLLIGLLQAYSTGYLSGSWQDAIVFAALVGMLIVRPTGLFGEHVAERM